MHNLDKFYKRVLKILSGNEIMTDGQTDEGKDGMTDKPNPIQPPLFHSGAINIGLHIVVRIFYRKMLPMGA